MACCCHIDIITTYTNNAANSSAMYGVMLGTTVFCPNNGWDTMFIYIYHIVNQWVKLNYCTILCA